MVKPKLLSPEQLSTARSLFPHIEHGIIYFNHASTAPLSSPVLRSMVTHLQERSWGEIDDYGASLQTVAATRGLIQKLINAESTDRIALVCNTSEALNIIASGIAWSRGDRVVLNDLEFPANVHPYFHLKRHGVELDVIATREGRITTEMISNAIRPTTRLVALSAVQFLSGYRADLSAMGKLCRQKGIWFVVDGIQAAGATQIDVQEMHIDAFAAGAQKWLMGPQGIGFLYLTEHLQSQLTQQYLGWLGVEHPWNFFKYDQPPAASARRFEGGTLNHAGIAGLRASLSTLLGVGTAQIESHILALTDLLTSRLSELPGARLLSPAAPEEKAGIVTIQFPERINAQDVFNSLNSNKMKVSLREGKLRFSPHYYNTPEEASQIVDHIKKFLD